MEEADLSKIVEQYLKKFFGYETFRGSQETVIRHVLDGQHALVIMPTGMGKSLCYQIPALVLADKNSSENQPLTLVISPLIALMKDQVEVLIERGIDATFINSSLSRNERESRYSEVAAGKYLLLYVTPERFRKSEFLDLISRRQISLLAIDEAHCVSEWGHDFRPDYTRLDEIRSILNNPPTIALTATATHEVQEDIVRQLGLLQEEVKLFHEGIDRPNLVLSVDKVWGNEEKLEQINAVAGVKFNLGVGIVYFTLIKTLLDYSEKLHQKGLDHVCYHGTLPREERKLIQEAFMEGSSRLVLATNAFGMGIDKANIRFVIHADVPGSLESYYQEIGRAGRDGLPAECLLLYDEHDLATQMEFIGGNNPSAEFYQRVYSLLIDNQEQVSAFGRDWIDEKIYGKNPRDGRLETVLLMLERFGVIDRGASGDQAVVVANLVSELADQERLDKKLERDRKKLYSLVEYANYEGDRKEFIHSYFDLPYKKKN